MVQGSELEYDHMDPPRRLCLATVPNEIVSEHLAVTKSSQTPFLPAFHANSQVLCFQTPRREIRESKRHNQKQWNPVDNDVLNSPFCLHFPLHWFQGPDWKPAEFSACCRFRWSHPSQTQRQRGIIRRLQPWSFSPYEVIHAHPFPIISLTWFPFNTLNLPNASSVDSKLIQQQAPQAFFF